MRLMKVIILSILLSIPLMNVAQDKLYHIGCSAVLVNVGMELKLKHSEAILLSLGIGFAKEFVYDKKPDSRDLLANFTGVVIGYGVNRIVYKIKHRNR